MGDLAQRMDAGIGAAGAMDRHGLAAKLRDRGFDRLLHRQPLRLALPADEPGAVIFDRQLVAGHGNKVPAGIGQPRRNASAARGARPGRCSLNGRSAPDPQATDSRSSSTVPGGSPTVSGTAAAASTRMCSPRNSKDAPGRGSNARTRRSSSSADCRQSSRPSSRKIFGA